MTEKIGVVLQRFNDRIRAMNQMRSKDMTMSAEEARNLHAEVFSLLSQIADLSAKVTVDAVEETVVINMDGGGF
tara:strand:+ start:1188 stop:1409 length:222 start_codon:yes stop_codon:yes gene_type:complete